VNYLGAPKLGSFVPMKYFHAMWIVDVAGKLLVCHVIKLFLKNSKYRFFFSIVPLQMMEIAYSQHGEQP